MLAAIRVCQAPCGCQRIATWHHEHEFGVLASEYITASRQLALLLVAEQNTMASIIKIEHAFCCSVPGYTEHCELQPLQPAAALVGARRLRASSASACCCCAAQCTCFAGRGEQTHDGKHHEHQLPIVRSSGPARASIMSISWPLCRPFHGPGRAS